MLHALRKIRDAGTVRTVDVVSLDLVDARRRAERLPTVRNLEHVDRLRDELRRRLEELESTPTETRTR